MSIDTKAVRALADSFVDMRFDNAFHLGLGDIRLAIGTQEEFMTAFRQCADEIDALRGQAMIDTKAVRALADESERECVPIIHIDMLRQCADEIDALRGQALTDPEREEYFAMKEDAKRYRWGVENARWIRHAHEAYVAIPVAHDADLSCVAMRTHAIDRARKGTT